MWYGTQKCGLEKDNTVYTLHITYHFRRVFWANDLVLKYINIHTKKKKLVTGLSSAQIYHHHEVNLKDISTSRTLGISELQIKDYRPLSQSFGLS
jgi:hypothetical protein